MLQPTNGYLGLETLILLLLPKSRNTPLGGTLINILVTLYAVVQSGKQKEHKSSQSEVRVVILNFHSLRKVTLIFGSTGGLFPYFHLQYITYWPQIQGRRLQYRYSMFTLSYTYSRYV